MILEEVQDIFRDVFDDEDLVISHSTSADEIEDWDSLAHIRLVVAIEKHFNIKFAFKEIQALHNVGEMLELISNKCRQ